MKPVLPCLLVLATALGASTPTRAADKEPSAVARALIDEMNKECEHRARIPASVRVSGQVVNAGRFEMRTTDTVWALLERAELKLDTAALDQVVLIRRDRDGNQRRHILNWEKREEYGAEPLLCDGDVVFITVRAE